MQNVMQIATNAGHFWNPSLTLSTASKILFFSYLLDIYFYSFFEHPVEIYNQNKQEQTSNSLYQGLIFLKSPEF